jgi:hypothetical protein
MEQIELGYATLSYNDPIVEIVYKAHAQLGFIEIRELIASAQKLSAGKPYLVFSDVRDGIEVTPLGKKVVSDPAESPLHRGTAVLLKSEMLVLAANFISSFKKEPYPFKAFTERKKAMQWLSTLRL